MGDKVRDAVGCATAFRRNFMAVIGMTAVTLASGISMAHATPVLLHARQAKQTNQINQAKPPLVLATQGNFFVGGSYTQTKDGQIMTGQMYVQYQIPAHKKHPYPIVMIHGGGQTGEGYYQTLDGREGWATYFLRRGYAVYVVDQVDRGRSGYFTETYGPTRRPNTKAMMQRFSVPQDTMQYPQAKLHTQWAGSGKVGDPVFDQFFAGNVEDMVDLTMLEAMNRSAGDALLDKIGPVILLVHSQSGPIGWTLANDRPQQIKGLIAVESSGPPFHELAEIGAPDWYKYDAEKMARPFGITQTSLTYSPAVTSAADLKPVLQDKADQPDLAKCYLQAEPAHQLPEMAHVKILMVGSEASYHVPYDHCTSAYLTQAGVKHDFVRVPSVGINGNGHFMMIEKNSDQVAAFLAHWLDQNVH
jgi:pimeloyl-ACP methyl ester carboxylesterase